MSNIMDYIKKYKDKTFDEEEFNELDNLVFCQILYLDFLNIISSKRKPITLNSAIKSFLNKNSYKDISKYGIIKIGGYKVIKQIEDTKRYKDVLVYNYIYKGDNNKQFGALTFKVKKNLIYVAFEGTDHLLSGWKENFQMSYEHLVPAQECAINYLNKYIKLFDTNIIVGGHSKGGNLALISSMYCNRFVRCKIKKIYSNDGQGLRKEQIESKNYLKIKDRYIHFVPNYSYIGILLRNDKYEVIKSSRKDILSHDIFNWQVQGTKLIRANLSTISKNLEKSVILWLNNHDKDEREKMITNVFDALEKSGIYTTNDLLDIKNSIKIIKNLNSIDEETKKLILNFLHFNLNYIIKNSKL